MASNNPIPVSHQTSEVVLRLFSTSRITRCRRSFYSCALRIIVYCSSVIFLN